jgi:hypothetical protein
VEAKRMLRETRTEMAASASMFVPGVLEDLRLAKIACWVLCLLVCWCGIGALFVDGHTFPSPAVDTSASQKPSACCGLCCCCALRASGVL